MALRKLVECKHARCHELTRNPEGYCDKHIGEYRTKVNADKKAWKIANNYKRPDANSKINKFYSSIQWQSLRKAALARDNFLCQECFKHGITQDANQVHHIKPVIKNWDERFDINNLESLCYKCHRLVRHKGLSWEDAHEDD